MKRVTAEMVSRCHQVNIWCIIFTYVTCAVASALPILQLENGISFDKSSAQTPSGHSSSDHSSFSHNREKQMFSSTYSTRGRRKYMEDFFVLSQDCCFAGVFDGHGGSQVSKFVKQTLYSNFLQLMPENKSKWHDRTVYSGLKNAVKKIDFEVSKIRKWNHQGSTLAAVYINRSRNNSKHRLRRINTKKKENDIKNSDKNNVNDNINIRNYEESDENDFDCNYSIVTINVGDSRIVLARGPRAIDLTTDHKPNMRSEKERIKRLGGTVRWHGLVRGGKRLKGTGVYRVNRNLSLSRAIGDKAERPCVSGEPDLRNTMGHPHTDEFIVLATDGLWDVLSSQEVVTFIHKAKNQVEEELKSQKNVFHRNRNSSFNLQNSVRKKIPKLLVEEALRKGSSDNITVVIQWLQ